MRLIGMQNIQFKEYIGELPFNTIKAWNNLLLNELKWEYIGWTGEPKEPFRHWASYPENEGEILKIWDTLNYSLKFDGFNLKPNKVIVNLFSHGDSSWIHTDTDEDNTYTVLLYLNDYWDINWGGETVLVENNEILQSFSPTPGKFIVFKSNILHGARPVSREAPYPRMGLVFQCDNNIRELKESKISNIRVGKL